MNNLSTQGVGVIIAIIVASLVVLFIMNPNGTSQVISSIGWNTQGESSILTGSGYRKAT